MWAKRTKSAENMNKLLKEKQSSYVDITKKKKENIMNRNDEVENERQNLNQLLKQQNAKHSKERQQVEVVIKSQEEKHRKEREEYEKLKNDYHHEHRNDME